ncbi:hypothetical protein F3Y22_tig00001478pilonHSYRG00457 [Hibiscus syriacus]|uniref:Uncharacterized protein n=1 Tax=Hibiscus syriacus TaxID=106335 RepID=A0A6A3CVA6_HIBSY|nr:hypothetical protein F3Y22_tig00001478pilonHSYRG00457 [Hibiscus syriacus]
MKSFYLSLIHFGTRGRGFYPIAPYSPFIDSHSPVDARSEDPHGNDTNTVLETIPETIQTTSHDGSTSQTFQTTSHVSSITVMPDTSMPPPGAIVNSYGRVQVLLHGPFANGKYEFQKRSYYRKPIGVTIKQNFLPDGFNWKIVPEETKHIYFDEFKNKYLHTLAAAQEATSVDESSSTSADPDKIFLEVAGGVSSKGRVFGVGSASPIYYNTFLPFDASSSTLSRVQCHTTSYASKFRGSTSTSMPLHPQARGSTPLAHFVQPPNNQEETYYPIPPSQQCNKDNAS